MKGTNAIELNSATVIEALQEYFDKRVDPHIEVTAIIPQTASGGIHMFRVTVKEKEEATK